MIRVCLVDDQTLVRQGVKSLLELADDIEVVAEASDGRQAVELIPEIKPDVVLMDMRMPIMSGLEALQALALKGQLPPTIILTTFDDDQLVLAGIKAGARGYLLKDVTLDQLVTAIQTVAEGGSLVQPAVTQRLLSGLEGLHNSFLSLEQPDPLTDRETEILRLMAGGMSPGEREWIGTGMCRRDREAGAGPREIHAFHGRPRKRGRMPRLSLQKRSEPS